MTLNRYIEDAPLFPPRPANIDELILNAMQKYTRWLRDAKVGDKYTYYVGLSPSDNFIYNKVAVKVRKDYNNGLVHPFTKRRAPEIFDYLVVRSGKAL